MNEEELKEKINEDLKELKEKIKEISNYILIAIALMITSGISILGIIGVLVINYFFKKHVVDKNESKNLTVKQIYECCNLPVILLLFGGLNGMGTVLFIAINYFFIKNDVFNRNNGDEEESKITAIEGFAN